MPSPPGNVYLGLSAVVVCKRLALVTHMDLCMHVCWRICASRSAAAAAALVSIFPLSH